MCSWAELYDRGRLKTHYLYLKVRMVGRERFFSLTKSLRETTAELFVPAKMSDLSISLAHGICIAPHARIDKFRNWREYFIVVMKNDRF